MARFMGVRGWDRQAYAREPEQEAEFVVGQMNLPPGSLVADIGAATGRHLPEWRRHGLRAVGLDLAPAFRPDAVADAALLPLRDKGVDAAVALGGIGGYVPLDTLLAELTRVARRVVVLATFNLPFARRHMGVEGSRVEETVHIPDGDGHWAQFHHGHECHAPEEMPGLVYGVEPGRYSAAPPSDEFPEILSVWHLV